MTLRAAIYARYSSDNQREASIEDQVEVCRRIIAEHGWSLANTYDDRAISGASRFRPAYQQMVADAERGSFDVIVVEALDRLSRKLADIAELHDRLQFARVRLYTAATGEVTAMHVGLLGTMAQLYLADLREKTKRGQLGRALKGKIPGGNAYGYEVVSGSEGGERRIREDEASVVRRIFEAFAAGESPRGIAKRLNADGVRGPGGRPWRDTTIRGQAERGTGLLNNALYAGRLEWNRCSYVKNPTTGKRVARPNPREQWEIVDVPHLRIVDDPLWQRVKARQQDIAFAVRRNDAGNALNRAHRRKFLLSGLLTCGLCGGGYTIIGKNRYGCAAHRSKGTCGNARSINRLEIEARVLEGLKERLMAPELVQAFVEAYHAEINRAARDREGVLHRLRRERSDIERKIESILRAVEDGFYNASLKDRLSALEERHKEIDSRLKNETTPAVRFHPGLGKIYRDRVARLETALTEEATAAEAGGILRLLIDRVELRPQQHEEGLDITLYGDLAAILSLCDTADHKDKLPGRHLPGSRLSVVAGARNQLYLLFAAPNMIGDPAY